MKELSSGLVKAIQVVEQHLCPQYCGVVDRRRVIAYLFLTMLEALVIPFHFFLFLTVWEPWGFSVACAHLLVFLSIQWAIWRQALAFDKGVAALFLMVACKLAVDSVFCTFFGYVHDLVSVFGNIFVLFILAISALSLMLQTTAVMITVILIPVIVFYLYHAPEGATLFSMKSILVGCCMIAYVYTYNMSKVTKGLRQPHEIRAEERKALDMLANLRVMDYEKAEALMERMSPELRQKIVCHATKRLRKEELDRLAWDMLCANLTQCEREVCKLVLEDHKLKDICGMLGKSESNITSVRCHIRRKLNMDRKDDLKRTLEIKIAEIRNAI